MSNAEFLESDVSRTSDSRSSAGVSVVLHVTRKERI